MAENEKRPTASERDRSPDGGKDLPGPSAFIQTPHERGHKDHEAFEKVAILIATVKVPLSKQRDHELLPSETPDTPKRWIGDFAEGMASVSTLTHQQAIAGIRAAFENKYGMTPEAYAETFDSKQKSALEDSKEHALRKAAQQEADRRQERESDRTRDR